MSDKTGSLWGCERIHGGPEEPPGGGSVTHIFEGVLVPSFTVPNNVSPPSQNAVNGIGQVLPIRPYLTVPVTNTDIFPIGELDANDEISFITYCETLSEKANNLAGELQTLYNTKIAAAIGSPGAGSGGGGVSEGVGNSCEEDFEIKANTFTINCNALIVDECGTPPPVTINSGEVSITTDGSDMTVTNGAVTLTISGSTINVTGGSLQVDGSDVLTQAVADLRYANTTHVHSYEVTQVSQDANGDISTSSASANTGGPA